MRYDWRSLGANVVEKEVERSYEEKTPDAGDVENDLGEFHAGLRGGHVNGFTVGSMQLQSELAQKRE
jgi:hypothetical protein